MKLKRDQYETLANDQTLNLMEWADYFTQSDSADLSLREKYWIFRNILKLEDFNPETRSFNERSKGTLNNYPVLDREVIRKVIGDVRNPGTIEFEHDVMPDEIIKYNEAKNRRNFVEMYSFVTDRQKPISEELLQITEGEWVKFNKGSDSRRLSDTVRQRSTGWCTAGYETAATQLRGGDFYVYLSKDHDGNLTVPRLAIRMEGDSIAEVRGVAKKQEIDKYIGDVLTKKMEEFPDGEEYINKEKDMKHLTLIHAKMLIDPQTELTKDEVEFIYELGKSIQGFGYQTDPRIQECVKLRPEVMRKKDMLYCVEIANKLIEQGHGWSVAANLDKFEGLNPEVKKNLIDLGFSRQVEANPQVFE